MKKGYRWIAFLTALLLVVTDGGMTVCASNSNTIGMTEDEEGQETLPEDGENTEEEEDQNDEEEEDSSEESDEVGEEEETEKQALAEVQDVTLTAPQKLTYNNNDLLTMNFQWQAVKGAAGYELYYAIDPEMKGAELSLDEYTLLATTKENKYIYDRDAGIGRNAGYRNDKRRCNTVCEMDGQLLSAEL